MIDLGLSKIAIIGVVALIVIGPEKLPKVARMVGSLYGRAQRYLNEVKSEVSREIELDELKSLQKEVQATAQSIKSEVESSVAQNLAEIESDWRGEPHSSVTPENLSRKVRDFRRKKLVRSSAIPAWYKQRHGGKTHVMSGAARVAKYRLGTKSHSSFY
ncbi:MAG: sec-independent protein translocase protein TatB [Janthinobacterium sp.]|jgi:sec-independent protein translocase protein TatB